MDLQQIKYFLAVVDTGTFLAASKQVYVSQPTLSAGIKKLEESLDTTLFYRGPRNATLTPEGETFLRTAREAYNKLMQVKSELSEPRQHINIGVLPNVHMDHVAHIVQRFRQRYPHILIKLSVDSAAELAKKLKNNSLDLTVVNSHEETSSNFIPLIDEALCVVVSNQHHLATSSTLALSELEGLEFIERINCSFWKKVFDAFQDQSIHPETIMQIERDDFVLPLVAANVGVSIMTNRTTPYDLNFIPIDDFDINRTIGLCINNQDEQSLSASIRAFIQSIESEFNVKILS